MKKHFWKNKNAEVMVEASLILSVAVIVVFMLFYLGFIMYHQTLITSVANQTASNIAQAYGNQYKDPVSGYVDVSNLDREGIVNKMKNQAYGEVIAKKAEWFSKYRMAKGEFLNSEDPVKVDVRIENKHGALLRAQIVVDVEASYDLPFVKFFGIGDSVLTYHSTGRADCYEIMDYVNIVEAADKIDVTENFQVTFHNKDQIHKVVEVMHDMSIAETCKLSAAQQTRFPADPTWSGERFYRWKMANGQTFTKDTVVTGNIDVYAEYDCRVIFVGYDGHTQFAMRYAHRNQRFQNGGESLPAGPGESGDNKFYCWWYNNAPFTADTVVPDRDTITVTIRKYLWVKFDANGGSVNESRRFVAPGAAVGNLPTPTRFRHKFDGWFTAKNGGTQYNKNTIINGNVTLYAHWREYCKVTFNGNGGTVSEKERWVEPDTVLGALPGASRQYYNLKGWFTGTNGGTKYGASTRINSSVTLYANWECAHPSNKYDYRLITANCKNRLEKVYCGICGVYIKDSVTYGDHDYGYCNVNHSIGYYPISTHAGSSYSYSDQGRHIVCMKCKTPKNGYWCTHHILKNGTGEYDGYWKYCHDIGEADEVKYH